MVVFVIPCFSGARLFWNLPLLISGFPNREGPLLAQWDENRARNLTYFDTARNPAVGAGDRHRAVALARESSYATLRPLLVRRGAPIPNSFGGSTSLRG